MSQCATNDVIRFQMTTYAVCCCSVLQYVAVCCSVLQCVPECWCSVLQCSTNDVIRFQMTTYAAKEISAGDELFVCYKTGGGVL